MQRSGRCEGDHRRLTLQNTTHAPSQIKGTTRLASAESIKSPANVVHWLTAHKHGDSRNFPHCVAKGHQLHMASAIRCRASFGSDISCPRCKHNNHGVSTHNSSRSTTPSKTTCVQHHPHQVLAKGGAVPSKPCEIRRASLPPRLHMPCHKSMSGSGKAVSVKARLLPQRRQA